MRELADIEEELLVLESREEQLVAELEEVRAARTARVAQRAAFLARGDGSLRERDVCARHAIVVQLSEASEPMSVRALELALPYRNRAIAGWLRELERERVVVRIRCRARGGVHDRWELDAYRLLSEVLPVLSELLPVDDVRDSGRYDGAA